MPAAGKKKGRVLLAGGGTGGHVFPAMAVGEELRLRGLEVSWMGRPEGMERSLAENRGLEYIALASRPLVGKSVGAKILAAAILVRSALRARRLIRRNRVAVVVGTGGYVSAPAVAGSFLARRPALLLEPNASAGSANRWLSKRAAVACTGFEETAADLACRSIHTGVPVRREFFSGKPPADEPTVLVVGGSQGALQINLLMPDVVEHLARRVPKVRIIHQTGRDHLQRVREDYERRGLAAGAVEVVDFIEDMATAMSRAHVIVSRAGALAIAEIAATSRAAVLVPLTAAGGHQRTNAAALARAGAAHTFDSEEATSENLAAVLERLLNDGERRRKMAAAIHAFARPDAAERIADAVEELGRAA